MDNYDLHPASIFKLPKENQDYVIRQYWTFIKKIADNNFENKYDITVLDIRNELLDECFTYFIYHDAVTLSFRPNLIAKLRQFRGRLGKLPYNTTILQKDILKTNDWKEIVDLAKETIRLWKNDPIAIKYSHTDNTTSR